MHRHTLQLIQPFEDRALDRVRAAVAFLVEPPPDGVKDTIGFDGQYADLMSDPAVLAAIGSALALGREAHAARRAALTLDLYDLGLPESRRSQLIAHASHPQRPMWLASGVRDRRLALWMYATCRTLLEDAARERVFLEDLAEALHIPVRDVRHLKQRLPLPEPAG